MKLSWLGHGSFKIETSTGKIIYLDPWIDENPACSLKLHEISRADIVCVTHGHIDHIGDSIEIVKKTGAVFIGTPELGMFARKNGIPEEGGSLCPLNIGGSANFQGIKVIMANAVHTSDIMINDSDAVVGSGACSYIIMSEDDPSIYFAGDTGVFMDMQIIADLYAPQIAMLPIGGKYTMGVVEAAYAAQLLKPKTFIPMHFATFPDQEADLKRLKTLLDIRAPATDLVILKPGESFTLP